MTEKKTSEAQLKASRNWQEKNKEQMNYIRKRSAARGFIKVATQKDFEEIAQLADEKELIKSVKYDRDKIKKLKKLVEDNADFKAYHVEDQQKLFIEIQKIIDYTADKRKELFAVQSNSNIIVTLDPTVEEWITRALKFQGKLADAMFDHNE